MYRFSEAIKLCDGYLFNLDYHTARMNKTRKEVYGSAVQIDLSREIVVPGDFHRGLYKCRIEYTQKIEKIEFVPYTMKIIKSLQCVQDNAINYSYKYLDRSAINNLFARKETCDDIIIIKNGRVTDCSSSNIVFFDGKQWVTPGEPLLKGTKRALLIESGKIIQGDIYHRDIHNYLKVSLINAMVDLEEVVVQVEQILL